MAARKKKNVPMVHAEREVTIRDYLIFQLKLLLDGAKDGVLFIISTLAVIADIISGRGKRPRLFYSVMRMSEKFDLWLNLNGAIERLDAGETEDGLFGASEAGSDSLLGQIEMLVRGGDRPKKPKELSDLTDEGPM